jgi:hypothetical protein
MSCLSAFLSSLSVCLPPSLPTYLPLVIHNNVCLLPVFWPVCPLVSMMMNSSCRANETHVFCCRLNGLKIPPPPYCNVSSTVLKKCNGINELHKSVSGIQTGLSRQVHRCGPDLGHVGHGHIVQGGGIFDAGLMCPRPMCPRPKILGCCAP